MFIILHYLISVYQNILKVGLGLSHKTRERGEFLQICSLWEYNKAWFACLLF